MSRLASLVPITVFTAAVGALAAAPQNTTGELPEGDGRDRVVALCVTSCHPATALTRARRSRAQWRAFISLMRYKGDGVVLSDEDFKTVHTYLLRHFGVVNVNTDPKEDVQLVLDIPEGTAAGIVDYRTQHGAFATLDDLAKVPGLDAGDVDGKKARIVLKP
jgi:hypothetical protein